MSKSTENTGNAWSDEEVAQLKQLAAQNTPTRVIGLKLGRTEDAIYSKAKSEGISLNPPNQAPYG
jgi:alanine-alpha-ketoisovalerate/valine-pyruvate aminotransferase